MNKLENYILTLRNKQCFKIKCFKQLPIEYG